MKGCRKYIADKYSIRFSYLILLYYDSGLCIYDLLRKIVNVVKMATIPAEIDLFTTPHCRMKELVNTYTQKLKNRLKQRHIYNSAVCDCHKDNRLSKVMNLVRNSKHLQRCSIGERVNFGEELQKCFFDFVKEFLPHMEEEENIFQPLMVEHFGYDELCALKEVVIEQHELIRDPFYHEKSELDLPEIDSNIKDFRDIDSDSNGKKIKSSIMRSSLRPAKKKDVVKLSSEIGYTVDAISSDSSFNFPVEILVKIFSYLSPPDRGRCAQVSSFWNEIIFTPLLWKEIYPIQWARGIWRWEDAKLNFLLEDEASKNSSQRDFSKYDEDADIDETENFISTVHQEEFSVFSSIISYLLPKIGKGVEKMVLDAGKNITSDQIRRALILCPNVTYFSASYTSFDYRTIEGLCNMRCFTKIRYLDLQGCENVDDLCLSLLAECLGTNEKPNSSYPSVCCRDNEDDNFSYQEPACSACPLYNWQVNQVPYRGSYDFSVASNRCIKYGGELKCLYNEFSSDPYEFEIEELANIETKVEAEPSLEYLNMSGCWEITDRGLYDLLHEGALQNITYLNVSGCFEILGHNFTDLVKQCPYLQAKNIFYCNNIVDGPYPSEAGGCDTINHVVKKCCQAFKN
ncbi:F-box/LRR-repeat protein 5 [Armadillidium nasatum]|uniref:F-box/LRR-repeat protein 5 n=1 Tax=Armadillidium nasatum TaxID=96803 RepID=A0A5N5T5K3_9CRUS|nr:F-box/LRR-repeat protein 5 [Armadillidium nasatum]